MSAIVTTNVQIGQSVTPTENFHWRSTTPGELVLSRGAIGAPTFDEIIINAGSITIPRLSAGGGTLAIADGGTGAITAAAALTNLGAAPSLSPTFTGTLTVSGRACETSVVAVSDTLDLTASNYFERTVAGASTLVFSSPPASGNAYAFALEVLHTSGTLTWPASVRWPGDISPVLIPGKTHLFFFTTRDGGTRWRGSSLPNYTT